MLSHFNQVCMIYAYTRPRYQVSVYGTIRPLVFKIFYVYLIIFFISIILFRLLHYYNNTFQISSSNSSAVSVSSAKRFLPLA